MRLPPFLLESQFFSLSSSKELISAMGRDVAPGEPEEIERLSRLGLVPASSGNALATMLGVNPGLIWAFAFRSHRQYRQFHLPKGDGVRQISAPRIGLKIFQKWFSFHLQKRFNPPDHVFGFVPGRSHLLAAKVHTSARWIYSVDVHNFFPTIRRAMVISALTDLGYNEASSKLLSRIFCLGDRLPQGSPASPVLSNLVFAETDRKLLEIATSFGVRLSRYADDIVFSGSSSYPEGLAERVIDLFEGSPWSLAVNKTEKSELPRRLKVHGLLVHGESIRLTKGYRNKLRAYQHLIQKDAIEGKDRSRVASHLRYARHVDAISLDN